jgi:hypothetical protein
MGFAGNAVGVGHDSGGDSQRQAAKILGMTQPKLSKRLRGGDVRGINEMKIWIVWSG